MPWAGSSLVGSQSVEVTQGFSVPTDSRGGASRQAVYLPLSLALAGLGKALERREGLSCFGSFPKVIFLPPNWEARPLLSLDCPFPSSSLFSIPSHSLLLPSSLPASLYPSSLQIKGLKIKTQFWWLVWGLLEAT